MQKYWILLIIAGILAGEYWGAEHFRDKRTVRVAVMILSAVTLLVGLKVLFFS